MFQRFITMFELSFNTNLAENRQFTRTSNKKFGFNKTRFFNLELWTINQRITFGQQEEISFEFGTFIVDEFQNLQITFKIIYTFPILLDQFN